ncbi:hypothetical protein HW115_19300 [Verrucomicrobiaceae bacterium N1E253]|uniref:Uncharacterized protein n=1 Tax=Oceaniferula marina TaxID=2748318 RepID=A0A851GTX4_9BACT|nr:hypothetical protein [Oceaniferula marina]NWK57774.1 hypothetical protein [Oceaniferula marina]
MTHRLLIFLMAFFPVAGFCKAPIVSFHKGDDTLDILIPSEVSLSEGLIRGGTGVNDVSYRKFLIIKVFEEALKLKEFIKRNQGQEIDIYIYGKKVVSPSVSGPIEKGVLSIYLPREEQYFKIQKILRDNLINKGSRESNSEK